jgi:Ca-activated chloride channel family protein
MFKIEYMQYIYGLSLLPIAATLLYFAFKWRKQRLSKIGDISLIQSLIPGYSDKRYWLKSGLILGGLLLLIISGINPQWGTKRENLKSESSDIFIALDISNSMYAEDIAPSRMERSKRYAQELIKELKGNRIGLVFFAGSGFIQMPLTNDYAAAMLLVKSASPNMAGTQGTAIGEAIDLAENGYIGDKNAQRAMIIITDGETHDEAAIDMAQSAKDNGCYIYTVGVGTEQGAPVPITIRDRKVYKTDNTGNQIISKLNVDMINQLADAGGGKPFLITQGKESIRRIVEDIDKLEKKEVQIQSFSEYNSYFQYFMAPGILLIGLGLFISDIDLKGHKKA